MVRNAKLQIQPPYYHEVVTAYRRLDPNVKYLRTTKVPVHNKSVIKKKKPQTGSGFKVKPRVVPVKMRKFKWLTN